MKESAYAKINLALNVAGKRSDGYHELEMIMVPLELKDEIEINFAKEDSFHWNLDMPVLKDNTMAKAVLLMRETFHLKQHFQVVCHKNIPMQAGLAGGSADAAAVMRGIASLCQLDISLEELSLLGKKIGADVPFCIQNKCALVKGIGEKIEPVELNADFDVLLIKPKEGVPTGKCFGMLQLDQCDHCDIEKVRTCLKESDLSELALYASNSLEQSAFQLVPSILEIKNELKKAGFEFVLMSGSGSCVFACTKKTELLNDFMQKVQKETDFVCKTKILLNKNVN